MRDTLLLAREHILHTYEEEQVELQALEIIEEAYPASQIRMMHRFALQVEKNGGEYGQPVLLMLETRRMWADRVYELLNERKRQRMGVFLSHRHVVAPVLSDLHAGGKSEHSRGAGGVDKSGNAGCSDD